MAKIMGLITTWQSKAESKRPGNHNCQKAVESPKLTKKLFLEIGIKSRKMK